MTRHLLANIYLFDQLGESELAQVDTIAEITQFNASARIFDQGDANRLIHRFVGESRAAGRWKEKMLPCGWFGS